MWAIYIVVYEELHDETYYKTLTSAFKVFIIPVYYLLRTLMHLTVVKEYLWLLEILWLKRTEILINTLWDHFVNTTFICFLQSFLNWQMQAINFLYLSYKIGFQRKLLNLLQNFAGIRKCLNAVTSRKLTVKLKPKDHKRSLYNYFRFAMVLYSLLMTFVLNLKQRCSDWKAKSNTFILS